MVKDYSESVVKCCLKKYLLDKKLLPIIEEWVINSSKIAFRGSLIVNHFLLYCINNGLQLPDLDDRLFYHQAFTIGLTGSISCSKEVPYLKDFVINNQKFYQELNRITGDTQLIHYLADQYMVNFSNSLICNFEKRQRLFINKIGIQNNWTKDQCYDILCSINNWNHKNVLDKSEEIQTLIKKHKQILQLNDNEKLSDYWIKKNLNNILIYQYYILKYFEVNNIKSFNLAPIYSMGRKFITIDSKILYFLMKQAKLYDGNEKEFIKDKDKYFNQVFNIKKLSKKEFGYFLQTDGTSLCVHFHTPIIKFEIKDKQEIKDKDERVIAIDPGRTNLIYGVEEIGNNKFVTYKLTKKQYYNDAHFTRNKKKLENYNKNVEELTTELTKYSSKTCDIEKYELFLIKIKQNIDVLQSHYMNIKCAKIKMDNYIHKNKTVDKFFNTMKKKGEKEPTIAYGAAKFAPNGKGELSAPTTFLAKKCAKKFKIKFVDEFRTTKCCADCESELKLMKRGSLDIRGLKCCRSSKCFKFPLKSRDKNAGKNILICYKLPNRPNYLSRNVPLLTEG